MGFCSVPYGSRLVEVLEELSAFTRAAVFLLVSPTIDQWVKRNGTYSW